MPVEGIISGVYGSQRILNGKPRWPHYGIDIAAKKGTEIKSSGTGVVTMAENDLYYTGGTIIMDHGHGISTIYSHLENVMVEVGDLIKKGDMIGTVGSTGRSTGPHLDFRINWFQTKKTCLKLKRNERALARPFVIFKNNKFRNKVLDKYYELAPDLDVKFIGPTFKTGDLLIKLVPFRD